MAEATTTATVYNDEAWRRDLDGEGMTTGDIKNNDRIFVALKNGTVMPVETPALILMTIHVPQRIRRRGVATQILDFLEDRCAKGNKRLVVGPIMEEEDGTAFMGDMCQKRGYERAPPFMYISPIMRKSERCSKEEDKTSPSSQMQPADPVAQLSDGTIELIAKMCDQIQPPKRADFLESSFIFDHQKYQERLRQEEEAKKQQENRERVWKRMCEQTGLPYYPAYSLET